MHLIKTKYDSSYYDSINEKRLGKRSELRNKRKFVKKFKASGTLMELGCGEGKLLHVLGADFAVQGIDISAYSVEVTNKLFDKNVAYELDLNDAFPQGEYDIIVAFDVLEHLDDPQKTMKAAYDHLRPGGVFIFTVPNNFGLVGSLATKCFNFIDRTHINTWQRRRWDNAVAAICDTYDEYDQIVYVFSGKPWAKYVSFDYVGVLHKSTQGHDPVREGSVDRSSSGPS